MIEPYSLIPRLSLFFCHFFFAHTNIAHKKSKERKATELYPLFVIHVIMCIIGEDPLGEGHALVLILEGWLG